jgi:hypothetical protein
LAPPEQSINSIAARFHLSISANRQGQENNFVRQMTFPRTPSEAKAAEPIQLMVEIAISSGFSKFAHPVSIPAFRWPELLAYFLNLARKLGTPRRPGNSGNSAVAK